MADVSQFCVGCESGTCDPKHHTCMQDTKPNDACARCGHDREFHTGQRGEPYCFGHKTCGCMSFAPVVEPEQPDEIDDCVEYVPGMFTKPEQPTCQWCGKPAKGHALIGDEQYCHEGPSPTCYEQAVRNDALSKKTTYRAPFAPLTMPRPYKTKGILLVPDVGWIVTCGSCGYNLTEHGTEYVSWHGDPNDGAEGDADSWYHDDCPKCGAQFGEREADDA